MATALCVMDVQVGIVARYASDAGLLARLARAIDAARRSRMTMIYVVVGFREGHPEVSPNNRSFSAIAHSGAYGPGDPNAAIPAEIAPEQGDIIVTKKRVSAFAGSDLDMVLRAQGIDALVLAGISTSGVVLSTFRQAADLDYGLTVLSDGCADGDAELHRVLLDRVYARQGKVVTVDEWIANL